MFYNTLNLVGKQNTTSTTLVQRRPLGWYFGCRIEQYVPWNWRVVFGPCWNGSRLKTPVLPFCLPGLFTFARICMLVVSSISFVVSTLTVLSGFIIGTMRGVAPTLRIKTQWSLPFQVFQSPVQFSSRCIRYGPSIDLFAVKSALLKIGQT